MYVTSLLTNTNKMDLFVCQGGRSWSLEEITLSLVICLIAKFAEVLVLIVDITRTLLRQPSSEGYTCSHCAVSDNCGPLTMPSPGHDYNIAAMMVVQNVCLSIEQKFTHWNN